MVGPVQAFISYSHKDEKFRDQFETHLVVLQRQGRIKLWSDRSIGAGREFEGEISKNLEQADLIVLLVSPDFVASAYCYDIEMARAIRRHKEGTALVIPVIVSRCGLVGHAFRPSSGAAKRRQGRKAVVGPRQCLEERDRRYQSRGGTNAKGLVMGELLKLCYISLIGRSRCCNRSAGGPGLAWTAWRVESPRLPADCRDPGPNERACSTVTGDRPEPSNLIRAY